MATEPVNAAAIRDDAQAYLRRLIDEAARIRLPALFEPRPTIYRQPDRNGVTTIVVRTSDMSEDELISLMKYRLAQYLAVNFVDPNMIFDAQIEYEPLSSVTPNDVHVIAGSTETGEILCYAVMKAPPETAPGVTLRERNRELFPVEKVHGWGIFNRLRILPDLPAGKIRELGRFVKNQARPPMDEIGARAPVEVGVAMFRALSGPLRLEVEAIVGDLEEGVAKQNLAFFHVPMVVIHGTVPYEAEASYFYPRYQYCVVYPFATLAADISTHMLDRLTAIETALAEPGKAGLLALFRLKREGDAAHSALEPPGGLSPLSDADVPQLGVPMANRRQLLDVAGKLRETDLFRGLSVAEATVLGTFMERQSADEGTVIVRQGDAGDDMYLIESGMVDVRVGPDPEHPISVAMLGPGDFFGEIALLTGAERLATVVSLTPVTLLRLSRDAFTRYLAHASEVEQQVTRAAMTRTIDTTRKIAGRSRPA